MADKETLTSFWITNRFTPWNQSFIPSGDVIGVRKPIFPGSDLIFN